MAKGNLQGFAIWVQHESHDEMINLILNHTSLRENIQSYQFKQYIRNGKTLFRNFR